MTPRSLRRDLALRLSVGLAVLWLLAMTAAGVILREEMDEAFDSALQQTAGRLLPLAVVNQINARPELAPQRVARIGSHDEYLTYVLRDADGRLLLSSEDADPATFAGAPQPGFRTTDSHRIYSASVVSGTYVIEVAEPLANREEALLEAASALLWPLVILAPLSFLFVGWLVRVRLAPVAALSGEVQDRDASDLSPLTTPGLQAELLPIRDAVNRLMARLRQTLEAERSLTANAAHELRTPVASSLAQAQRLVAEAPDGPLRARARGVEAELKRLARLAEKLLQLSQAEGGGVLAEAPADMGPILALVVEDFARAGLGDRLDLTLPPEALPLHIDPDAFAVLARNLIENALAHGAPAASVVVALDRSGLRVTNAGPVVDPALLPRLTTRFERGGSLAPGSGLGLAIVATIAGAAGLSLRLVSPAPGRNDGFEARVGF
ncbi:MAG: Integral rane sensor signal transduction histidine kinase precursor [Cereibacter sp.]|jgi:two-component system OmpR family sensor kinase|nr:Integral rane sensor signal transduction histidine kinase precursor [Cereibacter sp.]